MEVRILGPVEVWDGDRRLDIGGQRQKALLTLLALNANDVVSSDRLIDGLWGETVPRTAGKSLQNAISQLRRELGDTGSEILVTRAPGYALRLDGDRLDATRFERLAADARRRLGEEPARAAAELREALGLWRGEPLADLAGEPFAQEHIRRLEELRLDATEDRIDADLALGASTELVPELERLVAAHWLRERLRGQLMLALYRSGRQADALAVYRDGERRLREELGLEPGDALKQLERAILTQDPGLGAPGRLPPRPLRRRRRWWVAAGVVVGLSVVALAAARVIASGDPSPVVAPDALVQIDPNGGIVDVVPVGREPAQVRAGGDFVFVASTKDKTLTRVDTRTGEVTSSGEPGADLSLAVGGDRYVWATSVSRAEVSWLDAASLRTINRIEIPRDLNLAFVAVGAGSVWVTQFPSPAVSRYRLRTLELQRRYTLTFPTTPVELTYGAGAVWVALGSANELLRIDPRNGGTRRIPVGDTPSDPAVGFGSVWVAMFGEGTLWRIDSTTEKPRAIVEVGGGPFGIAIDSDSVWVTDACRGLVSRVDPATDKVVATIETGFHPLWVDTSRGSVWVGVAGEAPLPCP